MIHMIYSSLFHMSHTINFTINYSLKIYLESSESADLLAVRYGNYYPDNMDARAEDDVTELNGFVFSILGNI